MGRGARLGWDSCLQSLPEERHVLPSPSSRAGLRETARPEGYRRRRGCCLVAQGGGRHQPLNLAFLLTALCKFDGCHFPLQLAKALRFVLVLDGHVQPPKLLTCSCFMLSRSAVLTLILPSPPSSPSQYFTIQNISRAKRTCL